MRRFLRFDFLLPLILLAGMAQYAMVAFDVLKSGEASLWQLESDSQGTAGLLRYVKDFLVVFLSLAWLIVLPKLRLTRGLFRLVKVYFFWMTGIIFIGSLGFLLDYSPLSFLPAGLRWLLLLHAAFGVFILSHTLTTDWHSHRFIFRFLLVILLVDAYVVLLQFNIASDKWSLAFGASRLMGLFNNAGVAAFFAIAVALISFQLDGVASKKRMGVTLVCMFLALSSGSRFPTMAILLILLIQLWEMQDANKSNLKNVLKLMFIPMFFVAIFLLYQVINQQVGRGDAITQQFEKGGRFATLIDVIDMLSQADWIEVLIGRGLGIGTNTAITSNLAEGINPGIYRFNMLVDNVFITCIFQFGVLGSMLFWRGIYKFIAFARPKYSIRAKRRYFGVVGVIVLSLIAGSPFEHYFLMLSYAAALGAVYWSDWLVFQQIKMRHQ